jgi:hypothetical protein
MDAVARAHADHWRLQPGSPEGADHGSAEPRFGAPRRPRPSAGRRGCSTHEACTELSYNPRNPETAVRQAVSISNNATENRQGDENPTMDCGLVPQERPLRFVQPSGFSPGGICERGRLSSLPDRPRPPWPFDPAPDPMTPGVHPKAHRSRCAGSAIQSLQAAQVQRSIPVMALDNLRCRT